MVGRNVGEPEHDVATFAASYQQVLFEQGDRVAPAQWYQFSVHGWSLSCSYENIRRMMPREDGFWPKTTVRMNPIGVNQITYVRIGPGSLAAGRFALFFLPLFPPPEGSAAGLKGK